MILIDLTHGLVTWWLSSSLYTSYQGVHYIQLLGFKFMISWCKTKQVPNWMVPLGCIHNHRGEH